MLFSGGLVPSYIMWTQTFHIRNSIFALLVPNLLDGRVQRHYDAHVFHREYSRCRDRGGAHRRCQRVPHSGGHRNSNGGADSRDALPGWSVWPYWNDWQNGLYYLTDNKLFSIQVLLQNIQRSLDALKQSAQAGGSVNVSTADLPSNSVRMAITVMGVLPIMIVYPFLQRFFVKGIAIGAVKG